MREREKEKETYKHVAQFRIRSGAIRHSEAGLVIRAVNPTHCPVRWLTFGVSDKHLESVFGADDPHVAWQVFKESTRLRVNVASISHIVLACMLG